MLAIFLYRIVWPGYLSIEQSDLRHSSHIMSTILEGIVVAISANRKSGICGTVYGETFCNQPKKNTKILKKSKNRKISHVIQAYFSPYWTTSRILFLLRISEYIPRRGSIVSSALGRARQLANELFQVELQDAKKSKIVFSYFNFLCHKYCCPSERVVNYCGTLKFDPEGMYMLSSRSWRVCEKYAAAKDNWSRNICPLLRFDGQRARTNAAELYNYNARYDYN